MQSRADHRHAHPTTDRERHMMEEFTLPRSSASAAWLALAIPKVFDFCIRPRAARCQLRDAQPALRKMVPLAVCAARLPTYRRCPARDSYWDWSGPE